MKRSFLLLALVAVFSVAYSLRNTRPVPPDPEQARQTVTLPTQDPVKVAQSSVVLVAVSSKGRLVGFGSGVIVMDRSHVITNFHVVAAGDSYEVTLAPPTSAQISTVGVVVDFDVVRDVAVLKLRDELGTPVTLADAPPGLGDSLLIAGYPGVGGDTLTITRGIVSGFVDQGDGLGRAWIKTDAVINHGNSGGAALDAAGRLVGLPTFITRSGGDALGYIFSMQQGKDFLIRAVGRNEPLVARATSTPTSTPVVVRTPVPTATTAPMPPISPAPTSAPVPRSAVAGPGEPASLTFGPLPTLVVDHVPGPFAARSDDTFQSVVIICKDTNANPCSLGTIVRVSIDPCCLLLRHPVTGAIGGDFRDLEANITGRAVVYVIGHSAGLTNIRAAAGTVALLVTVRVHDEPATKR